MKGVVLAGGLGTRLRPLTSVTNKHLLPVYDQPMIFYPIQTLVNAGINDIMVVTGGNSAGDFLRLLGNGKAFGLKHLNYTYQEGEGGIAEALGLVEHFAAGEPVCVVLGDNIIEGNICSAVEAYRKQGRGAKIMLKKVPDPQRFGVPKLDGRKVVYVEEKPKVPQSDYAVIGVYMYDGDVYDIIRSLKPSVPQSDYAVIGIYMYDARVYEIIRSLEPSGRGELEITDVNNAYIDRNQMTWEELEGWWTDAGTFESLLYASNLVAETGANKMDSEIRNSKFEIRNA